MCIRHAGRLTSFQFHTVHRFRSCADRFQTVFRCSFHPHILLLPPTSEKHILSKSMYTPAAQTGRKVFLVFRIVAVVGFSDNNTISMRGILFSEPVKCLYLIAPMIKMLTSSKAPVLIVRTQPYIFHYYFPFQLFRAIAPVKATERRCSVALADAITQRRKHLHGIGTA